MLHYLLSSNKRKGERGSLLLEIVIVAGIVGGSLSVILGLATTFLVISHIVQQTSQATALAQEGLEVVRNVRDGTSWTAGLGIVAYGPAAYRPEQSGNPAQWILVSGSEVIEGFTRQIMFEEVRRDTVTDDIVTTGGSADSDTKKAIVKVSWQERGKNHEVALEAYFTNWKQ